jgi:hypothetical protein
MKDDQLKATCCFCGQSLSLDKAIEITIKINRMTDELQTIYSHTRCIDKAFHESVPRGFDVN